MCVTTDKHTPPGFIACTNTHIPRGGTRTLPRKLQLTRMHAPAYSLHQCGMRLFSRDCRIADCTVRYPGVDHPFSSLVHDIWPDDARLYTALLSALCKGLPILVYCATY